MDAFTSSSLLLSLLIFAPLSLLTIPFTTTQCGRVIGWYIRKKTAPRRELLLSRAEAEEKEHGPQDLANADEEWEQIESYTTDSSNNGEKGSKDWTGIIGFFHPFWFVFKTASLLRPSILSRIQQCRRWRRTSTMGCYSCYPTAVAWSALCSLHWRP